MGLVTLTFKGKFQGLGDRKDIAETNVHSGITQLENTVAFLSSGGSATLALGLLSNIHGLYLHFTSAASTTMSGLFVFQAGLGNTSGCNLSADAWIMERPFQKTVPYHVFINSGAGGGTFEYALFGV